MKKLLAMALALTFTCAALSACGDTDSESSNDANSKAAEVSSSAADTESVADSTADDSAAESTAESTADSAAESAAESTADNASSDDAPQPRDISEVSGDLKNYETASLKFTADSDISMFEIFNEPVKDADGNEKLPGEEGYTGNEALVDMSVEELGGVPMLKLKQNYYAKNEDGSNVIQFLKIRCDMSKLFEGQEDKLADIFTVKMDIVCVAADEWVNVDDPSVPPAMVPGWCGGAFGTNNNGKWNGNMIEWSVNEFTSTWAATDMKIRPGVKGGDAAFNKDNETNYLTFMTWGITHDVDVYIADIQFEDADGNVITLD